MESAIQKSDKLEPLADLNNKKVEIYASIAEKITFASQQNDVPLIADLNLINITDETLEGLELSLNCEPALIESKVWRIDRISPNSEVRVKNRGVSLDGGMLSKLTERMKARVTLELRQDQEILATEQYNVTGLAKNEWGGAAHMPELLSAFIMPNDPSISDLLKEAAETLRSSGHKASFEGYQSKSRKRVWQITSAIWAAISSKRIIYAEPPSSFEKEGQKIRTPSEVLSKGLATCLDSSLLFASALEQAGLYPIIAFTEGHAFCGVWLQPQHLPSLIVDDPTDLRKYIALKELVLFETTFVTNEPPMAFSKAIEEANRQIAEDQEAHFIYALDIKRARSHGISPLASIIEKSSQNNSEKEQGTQIKIGLEEAPDLPSFDLGIDDGAIPDTPETRLDNWKRKLLDLTKRNRLLNLKPSKTAIKLHCTDPALLEDKLADGKKIVVIPMETLSGDNSQREDALFIQRTGEDFKKNFISSALERDEIVSDLGQKDLDAGMVELYRKARTDLQEGGANTLYLALGVLKWKQSEHEERTFRAPLILLPVTLERKSAASRVKIVLHEDEPVFNKTLLEMLRQDFELEIPQLENELPKDHSGIDVHLIWEWVRKAVRDIPNFEVIEEIVLSTFSFSKYLMWKDLAERTELLKQSAFVEHLIETPRDAYEKSASFMPTDEIDEKIKPSELFMPLPADSSQIVAVHASAQNGDFVLEGPPGTGKSQTIANIIAHNLAIGKKVLFVSEKMAALEVVYKRLKDHGLGDFCLELHSNKANKKEVINQLGSSWHSRNKNTQSEWHKVADELLRKRNELNGLVEALHNPGPSGVSPRSAIGRASRWKDVHRFRLDWPNDINADIAKNKDDLNKLEDISNRLGQTYGELSQKDKDVFIDIKHSDWSNAWQSSFVEKANKLSSAISEFTNAASLFIEKGELKSVNIETITQLEGLAILAGNVSLASKHDLSYAMDSNYFTVFKDLEEALNHHELYMSEKKLLSSDYSDTKIASAPISQMLSTYHVNAEQPWGVTHAKAWLFTRKIKKYFDLFTQPVIPEDLYTIQKLQGHLKAMDNASTNLSSKTPWKGLKTNTIDAKESLDAAKQIRQAILQIAPESNDLNELRDSIKNTFINKREFLQEGSSLFSAAKNIVKKQSEFRQAYEAFLTEANNDANTAECINHLKKRAENIIEMQPRINAWCRWQAICKEAQSNGLGGLIHDLENSIVEPSQSLDAFKTAYAVWLAPILQDQRKELRTFSSLEHEDKIAKFRELDKKLSQLSVDYITAKLSGDIPNPQDKSRGTGYGILQRELQKQKRHKPVRQLVNEMGEALTSLTPCLLMSPLSVAQFLDANSSLFDLVVFDEASQITVWDAIGAIARGKNVIVVGDPKQMPPTNFFNRAASDDESDDDNFDDMESILDEALAASVKLHRLTGHYRSRHESLIAFSNHRYYKGDLVTYPSSETRQSAVSFVRCQGLYQRGKNRTNPEEAKAVVKEVIRRLNDPELSKMSIGVVTLNSEQQRLIDDLIDNERRKNPELEKFFNFDAEEPVFIKNLETVQGDQRDVILLSIGYGPNTPGSITMPMQFGPLNRKGGERRLNVAITRATSEVLIFASFDPSMIDLTRTSAQALRDLKHYLEFADRGPSALGEAITSIGGFDSYDSDFEEAIAEALRHYGWAIHTQIGVSKFRIDLGIVHPDHPGKYLAGIECDGATYHSSPSARDRDRVRHAILENLGWKLVRIWSTDYWNDPATTIENVNKHLERLLKDDRAQATIDEISLKYTSTDENSSTKASGCSSDENEEYEENSLPREIINKLSAERFYEDDYLPVITDASKWFIDKSGPITFKYLSTKIARIHGFNRTGSQIKKRVWAAVSNHRTHKKSIDSQTVFWPKNMEAKDFCDFQKNNIDNERGWSDVPYPEKLGLAIQINNANHIDPVSFMAKEIGLERIKKTTKDELEELLSKARDITESI